MNHPWFKDFSWVDLINQQIEPPYNPLKNPEKWERNFDQVFINFKPDDSMSRDDFVHLD